MPQFESSGRRSSFEQSEQTRIINEAVRLYEGFVQAGKLKNIMNMQNSRKLDEEIHKAWLMVYEKLRGRGIKLTEEISQAFLDKLNNDWGAKHIDDIEKY